jgi:hypothetical protein
VGEQAEPGNRQRHHAFVRRERVARHHTQAQPLRHRFAHAFAAADFERGANAHAGARQTGLEHRARSGTVFAQHEFLA